MTSSSTTTDANPPDGVSADAWAKIGAKRNGTGWHIHERSSDGEVIGTATRLDDGRKLMVKGSHRGLTMAWPLDAYAGATCDDPILIVEGATDTATGIALGFDTIGRPSATGGAEHLKVLCKARHVAIIGENDSGAGKAGAEKIANVLHPVVASVRVLFPPDSAKDLREWANAPAGVDRDELLHLIDREPLWQPKPDPNARKQRRLIVRRGDSINEEKPEDLWPRRIPRGGITIAFSRPGGGKSTMAASLTGIITTGRNWPDGTPCARGTVIYVKGEGSDTAIRERMDAAGADPSRYFLIGRADDNDAMIDLANDVDHLREVIRDDTAAIIVDTLDSTFPSMRMIDNANIRRCLWPLQKLAENRGLAVIILAHTNKGQYADPLDRLSGGRAIGGAARAIWYLGKSDPDSDEHHMAAVKCNDFIPADSMAYRIDGAGADRPGYITWLGGSGVSAWDLDGPRKSADHGDKAEACQLWLHNLLANGPVTVAEVTRLAANEGHGGKVMRRARATLEVKSVAQKGTKPPVYWMCLPGQYPQPKGGTPLQTPKGVRSDSGSEIDLTPPEGLAVGTTLEVGVRP